jgi:signal peptidase I
VDKTPMNRSVSGIISAVLSLIIPGLGQLRNGQFGKAIVFYLLWYLLLLLFFWTGLYVTFGGLILILIVYLGLMAYFIFDAFLVAFKTGAGGTKPYNKWLIYVLIIIINIFVAAKYKEYINSNWITAHHVPTSSMASTLFIGDYFIGDYKYYKSNPVIPGEVIILKFPKNPEIKYIERCIALGGQTVEIKDKAVYVDGVLFKDSTKTQFIDNQIYSREYKDPEIYPEGAGNRDNYGPVTVPENHCFVLGDNRDNSYDSRFWGFVPLELVVAKPLYIYWSGDKNRIGRLID